MIKVRLYLLLIFLATVGCSSSVSDFEGKIEARVEQKLDGMEDIEILKKPIDEIPLLIEKGEIEHALVICAFYFYNQYLSKA